MISISIFMISISFLRSISQTIGFLRVLSRSEQFSTSPNEKY